MFTFFFFYIEITFNCIFFCNRFRMDSASGGDPPMARRDPTWKYCSPIEGSRNWTICNLCGLLMKSGGIT